MNDLSPGPRKKLKNFRNICVNSLGGVISSFSSFNFSCFQKDVNTAQI